MRKGADEGYEVLEVGREGVLDGWLLLRQIGKPVELRGQLIKSCGRAMREPTSQKRTLGR